jgi:hypothetical protein
MNEFEEGHSANLRSPLCRRNRIMTCIRNAIGWYPTGEFVSAFVVTFIIRKYIPLSQAAGQRLYISNTSTAAAGRNLQQQ